MIKLFALAFIIWSQSGNAFSPQSLKQMDISEELDVIDVGTISGIYIKMQFHTFEDHIFIRYCADRYDGVRILCPLQGSIVEVRTSKGWRPLKRKTRYGILGAPSRDFSLNTIIKPHTEVTVLFELSKRDFEFEPGQKLRVVIDTWQDELSMKNNIVPIKIYSRPFNCPKMKSFQ